MLRQAFGKDHTQNQTLKTTEYSLSRTLYREAAASLISGPFALPRTPACRIAPHCWPITKSLSYKFPSSSYLRNRGAILNEKRDLGPRGHGWLGTVKAIVMSNATLCYAAGFSTAGDH